MNDPECDNRGRDLDDDDLKAEICVCGAPLPPETRRKIAGLAGVRTVEP